MLTEYKGLTVTPCTPDHVAELPWTNQDPAFEKYARVALANSDARDQAFSFTAPEGLVMCGGLVIMSPGVAWVWLMTSRLIKKYTIAASGACLLCLKELAKQNQVHRLQTAIYPNYVRGIRFVEWLGFHKEGVMEKYSPDKKDYFLYAKIMKEE